MIKLANILSEIRVNQPINIFPKDLIQKIIDINVTSLIPYKSINVIALGDGDGYILYCNNF